MKRQYKYNTFVNDESIFTFIFTLKVLLFIDMCACLCVCACGDPFFFFSFKFSIVGETEGLCQGGLNLKITHILEEGKLRDD